MARGPGAQRLKRAAVAGVLALWAITVLLSLPAVTGVLVMPLQIYPMLGPDPLAGERAGAPGAIVILSAGRRLYAPEFGGQTVDAVSLERVRYGAYVARKTGLPVLVSGGAVNGTIPLAQLLAETLERDYGIHPRWIENRSANTAENAIHSAALLKRDGISRVVLVTHAWHMRRAVAAFRANGVSVIPAPTAPYIVRYHSFWNEVTPNMNALHASSYALHELVGLLWYRLRYGY